MCVWVCQLCVRLGVCVCASLVEGQAVGWFTNRQQQQAGIADSHTHTPKTNYDTHTQPPTHTHTRTQSHPNTQCETQCLTHTHTHTLIQTPPHTPTHTHAHTPALY